MTGVSWSLSLVKVVMIDGLRLQWLFISPEIPIVISCSG